MNTQDHLGLTTQNIPSKTPLGVKPKNIPLRVLDEEVWLSGSELKTDNSSSDEEKGHSKRSVGTKNKKGARKKIRSVATPIKQKGRSKSTEIPSIEIESEVMMEKRLSSGDAVALVDCGLSTNQPDDEKSRMQTIKNLEERIRKAEKKYTNAKESTDKSLISMMEAMNNFSECEGTEWDVCLEIIQEFIMCFLKCRSRPACILNIPRDCSNCNDREFSKKKGANWKISKSCRNSKFLQYKNNKIRKKKFNKNEKDRLTILMNNLNELENNTETFFDPYKLTIEEQRRISSIAEEICALTINENDLPDLSNYHSVDEFEDDPICIFENKEKYDVDEIDICSSQNDTHCEGSLYEISLVSSDGSSQESNTEFD